MSTTTTNYNLIKPELTDAADITAMNSNWDTLDTKLKELNDSAIDPSTVDGKVSKSGDTLTGVLSFQNKTDYAAIGKFRTINGTDYYVDFGCGNIGGKGCVSIQYMEGSTVKGRLEISANGVSFYDENNKRTYLDRNNVVTATVE